MRIFNVTNKKNSFLPTLFLYFERLFVICGGGKIEDAFILFSNKKKKKTNRNKI